MNSSAEDEIINLSKQKWASAQDVAPLAALFNEAAVFVHMGATFSKKEELDVIKTGRIHYRDVDIKDVSVRVIGSTAIVLTPPARSHQTTERSGPRQNRRETGPASPTCIHPQTTTKAIPWSTAFSAAPV
jgi:Domain of unknown function (DUF4440)